jgi:hypothetical protein
VNETLRLEIRRLEEVVRLLADPGEAPDPRGPGDLH